LKRIADPARKVGQKFRGKDIFAMPGDSDAQREGDFWRTVPAAPGSRRFSRGDILSPSDEQSQRCAEDPAPRHPCSLWARHTQALAPPRSGLGPAHVASKKTEGLAGLPNSVYRLVSTHPTIASAKKLISAIVMWKAQASD
jgi:hypothetical protein